MPAAPKAASASKACSVLPALLPVEDEALKDWGHVSNPAFL